MLGVIVVISSIAVITIQAQEARYDRVFTNPRPIGWEQRLYINGTLYETRNFDQHIIYNWSELSANAKRIINASMITNGYTESERAIQTP